jgi:hypothetical protein
MRLTRRRFIGLALLAAGCHAPENTERGIRKAVLISPYQDRLDDLLLMWHLLERRGFQSKILSQGACTKRRINEELGKIAESSSSISKTFLYYGGHYPVERSQPGGSFLTYQGFRIGEGEKLSPEEMFSALSPLKGRKAVVIDACHSGLYTEYVKKHNPIRNYVVIAACPRGTETLFGKVFIKGRWTGALTYGIYKALSEERKINLSDENIMCGTEEYRKMSPQELKKRAVSGDFPISLEIQRESDTDFWI